MNRASMSLPGRPRAHELEQLSVRAFQSVLPIDRVTVRERTTPEYGVDLDGELFRDRKATGAEFAVQLKATDDLDGSAPSVRVKVSTVNYWDALNRPVLVVLWEAKTGDSWYAWSHKIDRATIAPGQKTTTLSFDPSRRFDDESWESIEREILAFHGRTRASSQLPLPIRVKARGSIGAVSAGRARLASERLIRRHPSMLDPQKQGQGPQITVLIRDDAISVETEGVPDTEMQYRRPKAISSADAPDENAYAADVMIGIALQLGRLDLIDQAAHLVATHWRDSLAITSNMLGPCLGILVRAGDPDTAIEIATTADSASPEGPTALPALSVIEGDDQTRSKIAAALRAWAQREVDRGDVGAAAIALVNAARAVRRFSPAMGIQLFDEAAELDPAYKLRDYWWRERGGMQFLSGQFEGSVESYRRATAHGNELAKRLYGDALIFAGQYRAGVDQLLSCVRDGQEDAEYRLKARCFGHLIERVGIQTQRRDPEAAESAWDYFAADTEMALKVLSLDALHAPALLWLSRPDADHSPDVMISLCAAMSDPGSPVPWSEALSVALVGERQLYEDALVTARRTCGQNLIEFFLEIEDYDSVDMYEDEFARFPPERPERRTVYHVNGGEADYKVLDLDRT
jgi:tetratricopeptide (TPR) repeat protein